MDIFHKLTSCLPVSRIAKAYIENLFIAQIDRPIDLSKTSIVMASYMTRQLDLVKHQMIGDWILWTGSFFPNHINPHRTIIEPLGQLSYLKCFKLVPTWRVYEELADMMPKIIDDISSHL